MSVLFLCVLACLPCCSVVYAVEVSPLLTKLADEITKRQIKSGKNAGLYEIEAYIHVPPTLVSKYSTHQIDDNIYMNMWVVLLVLEASMYSGTPFITPESLKLANAGLAMAHDQNEAGSSSMMMFYAQTYNSTSHWWQCLRPNNDINPNKLVFPTEDEIRQYLQEQGTENVEIFAKVTTAINPTVSDNNTPPDFDSTSLYMGIGAILAENKLLFPAAHAQWMEANPNPTSATDAMKSFAYRPFDTNNPNNSTDPKSYYAVRHFIQEAFSKNEDFAIVPTYIYNQDRNVELDHKGKPVTFTMNDLDLGVCSQAIYTIGAAILFDILPPDTLDDPDMEMIYLNTTAYVLYEIRNNFFGRQDLAMTYYRSINQFYWFTSRILSLLERVQLHRELPHPSMVVVYNTMKDVFRGQVTQELLDHARPSVTSEEIYFLNFPEELAGRVYNTAITTLALLNIWSIHNVHNKTTTWINGTPVVVQQTIAAACKWLAKSILDDNNSRSNTFFSAMLAPLDLPFWYPANRIEYFNGTKFTDDCDFPAEDFVGVVEGYIPEDEYQAMMNRTHFGVKTPREFSSLEESFFKCWSSETITYGTTLLALSQYGAIIQNS